MFIDAHLHIDTDDDKPIATLYDNMTRCAIDKGVLIINTEEERQAINNEFALLDEKRIRIAFGLNPHDESSIEFYLKNKKRVHHNRIAKIHPRFMHISKEDYTSVMVLLDRFEIATVIIDTLVYGPRNEFNTGIELGIWLAEANTDLKVVLAHSGSTRMLECMMMTRWIENIYYDLSFVNPYFLTTSVETDMRHLLRRTANKVMFGSDYPSFPIAQAKNSFEMLCNEEKLSIEEIYKVSAGNAIRIYDF